MPDSPNDPTATIIKRRDAAVAHFWTERDAWGRTSRKLKASIDLFRLVQMFCVILGAACATAAATDVLGLKSITLLEGFTGTQALGVLGAFLLALVAFIEEHFLSRQRVDQWPRCRSIAESLKSEVFKFRAGAKPYDAPPLADSDPALAAFNEKCAEAEQRVEGLRTILSRDEKDGTDAPAALDQTEYLEARVADQIQYYEDNTRKNDRLVKLFRAIFLVTSILGVLFSLVAPFGAFEPLGAWIPVLTTISVATLTYASIKKFEVLASSYQKQGGELKRLKLAWETSQITDWSEFVSKCEDTISAENREWMAEQLKAPPKTIKDAVPENLGT